MAETSVVFLLISVDSTDLIGKADAPILPHCSLCTPEAAPETLTNKQEGKPWSCVSLLKERVEVRGERGLGPSFRELQC